MAAKKAVEAPAVEEQAFEFHTEKHLLIEGRVYEKTSFSEDHIAQISAINFADNDLAAHRARYHVASRGRDAMVQDLLTAIVDVEPVHVVEADEPAA